MDGKTLMVVPYLDGLQGALGVGRMVLIFWWVGHALTVRPVVCLVSETFSLPLSLFFLVLFG